MGALSRSPEETLLHQELHGVAFDGDEAVGRVVSDDDGVDPGIGCQHRIENQAGSGSALIGEPSWNQR